MQLASTVDVAGQCMGEQATTAAGCFLVVACLYNLCCHRKQCLQVPEFQDLPANTIESMALVLTERVVPPKGVIYYQGSEVEDVFFVQQGRIKVAQLHQSAASLCMLLQCYTLKTNTAIPTPVTPPSPWLPLSH